MLCGPVIQVLTSSTANRRPNYEDSNWYWNFVGLVEMIPTILYKQTTVDFESEDLLLTFSITAVRYDVRRIRAVGSNLI